MKLEMARVQIIGLKRHQETTVRVLHSLGAIQIEDLGQTRALPVPPLNPTPDLIRRQEELSYLAARVEALLSALPTVESEPMSSKNPDDCRQEARQGVEELGPTVQALISRRDDLEAEQAALPRYEAMLRKLVPLLPPSARHPEQATVAVLISRRHAAVLTFISQELTRMTEGLGETVLGDVDEETRAAILVFPQNYIAQVQELLGREDIIQVRLPLDLARRPLDEAVARLHQRLAAIPGEIAGVDAELVTLAQSWRGHLACWRRCLRDRLEEIGVMSCFGQTDHTFIILGWVPRHRLDGLQRALETEVGEEVLVQEVPVSPEDEEKAPVALNNPGPARPFQRLVALLALPRYKGIDPTSLMAFFLPLFFGMILGDIGYGAIVLALSLYGMQRFRDRPAIRDLTQVLAMGSAWGIVFGLIYGEFLGTLGEHLGLHPLVPALARTEAAAVKNLLIFTIGVGVAHIVLGLILGVWEALRERSKNHLLERGGTLLGLIALFWIAGAMADVLPKALMTPGYVLLLVGVAMLGLPLGWVGILMGPIEFISVLGNILSYLRIAAIGLASVYLAVVANDMAGALGSGLVGIVVAVLFHGMNIVMGAFSPTIHSLRLHYVEFFRKFYEGGGQPFQPFGRSSRV